MGEHTQLKGGLESLLKPRGLVDPDGRPLYAYKFARADFDRISAILRRYGPVAIHNRDGAALVVFHVAEWFRRERSGGHWDWIRPLRAIGFDYGPYATIQYRDVESMVSLGLRVWRRPEPSGGERLLAIVREAGFPVAAVREDPRIASWLKYSVLCAERGFSIRDAVTAEAWRVSDRLAQALFGPAIEFCENIVALRASLPPPDARGDPVDYLDQNRPGWRAELPFDVEYEDIRSMVDQVVRLRDDGDAALDVGRHLVRVGDEWRARASLGLSGRIDLRRLPSSIAQIVREGRRLRIFPRPPFCEELIAVAAIETFENDEAPVHELRAFVAKFDAPLALEEEARLLVQSGNTTVGEFIPTGGEPLHEPVIALQIEQIDENESPTRLRVLGASPVRTSRPMLALAVHDEHFHAVSFSAGFTDLGRCIDSHRRVVSFSGSATFTLGGARWSWRTSAERDLDARPVLVGGLVRNVRETVFCGVPQLWIERDGHLAAPNRRALYWRPRGRGTWRLFEDGIPWGDVDLAVIENDELRFVIGTSIVPSSFNVVADRSRRELRIAGLGTRRLAARGATDLEVGFDGDVAIVRLGSPTGTAIITLRARWDAELALTYTDPSYDLRLIDSNDTLIPPRSSFSVDGLKGLRILATREVFLCMELRANDTPRLTITRSIVGEVPLSAFTDAITHLLGSSESLDARVSLCTIGGTEHIADVRWYAEDIDPFDVPPSNAFSVLATTHGLDLQGIALAHPAAGSVPVVAPASLTVIRDELSSKLPPGPWLIYGRRRHGAKIRPRIVPAVVKASAEEETLLERAIGIDTPTERAAALLEAYSQSDQIVPGDRRKIIDLLILSRREGLPVSSIDALKALDHWPGFATLLLASCESLDERAALLDLQRDLPFLWSATTIADWLSAFSARIDHASARLSQLGIDTGIVYRSILTALGDIVGLRPELAGHAKAVFLMRIAGEMTRENKSIDGAAVHFLQVGEGDGVRREIDRLIGRHDENDPPPRSLLRLENRAAQQSYWAPYDESFADVIAVPFAVADHASGRMTLDQGERRRCRDAWLYDPEYFEAVLPIGIDGVLRSNATIGGRPG
ncbi:STY4851/ECs_5259 family protein [Nitratireductor soli]|uniref:STY4851/ECs_5259 family protein n=1 Tax=Nitratireductor soli TaxID=1670619 RepID=UPI0012FC2293|nr:STY4851/ECs_5259 family protein [Nitratireductor soli]